jgi:hypothetical protein
MVVYKESPKRFGVMERWMEGERVEEMEKCNRKQGN